MARRGMGNGEKGGQEPLFDESGFLPTGLPLRSEQRPASHLLAIFEECHHYIYANEGLLKEKIFHEVVKLLLMKLTDEQGEEDCPAQFALTSAEYHDLQQQHPTAFLPRLQALFAHVRQQYPTLFATETGLALQPLTLAFLVSRLQYLSLTQTPGDVKGEAFQSFVYRHQRGDRGEFFTPHPIVRLTVEMLAPQPHERIADPTCGSGGFLLEAANYVARQSPPGWEKGAYLRQNVYGMEFNPDIAQAAMTRLAFEGGTGAEVQCMNALTDLGDRYNTFDVILTNPPFGSKGKVESAALLEPFDLAQRWVRETATTWRKTEELLPGQTPDILLIEQCLRLLRPGGRMGIVLPDGLLQNVSNGYVRQWLRLQAEVLGVVSLPQETFVPYGTGIKTSVLLVRKHPTEVRPFCLMARLRHLGYDVKGQPVYCKQADGTLQRNSSGSPVLLEDRETITTRYQAFLSGEVLPPSIDIFSTPLNGLSGRLDVEHYLPQDVALLHHLGQGVTKRLGEVATLVTESDPFRRSGDAEIRYIALSDIDARTMQIVSQQEMRAHEAPSRATYRVRAGDILTAVSGASTGTLKHVTALVTEEEAGAICSNGLAVLRDVQGLDPLYLLCYMRTEPFLRQVRRLMTGHAIPAISLDDLASILVPIPPLAQQQEIVQSMARVRQLLQAARQESATLIASLNQTLLAPCEVED